MYWEVENWIDFFENVFKCIVLLNPIHEDIRFTVIENRSDTGETETTE